MDTGKMDRTIKALYENLLFEKDWWDHIPITLVGTSRSVKLLIENWDEWGPKPPLNFLKEYRSDSVQE